MECIDSAENYYIMTLIWFSRRWIVQRNVLERLLVLYEDTNEQPMHHTISKNILKRLLEDV